MKLNNTELHPAAMLILGTVAGFIVLAALLGAMGLTIPARWVLAMAGVEILFLIAAVAVDREWM